MKFAKTLSLVIYAQLWLNVVGANQATHAFPTALRTLAKRPSFLTLRDAKTLLLTDASPFPTLPLTPKDGLNLKLTKLKNKEFPSTKWD